MNNLQRYSILIISTLVLYGCSTSTVIPSGADSFMVTSSGIGFGTAGVREKVFFTANEYCAEHRLVMVPVSFKARPGEYGRNPPSADLIFRAVKPGDPAIGSSTLTEADQVQQNIKIQTRDESPKDKDMYTEILKLDDLRKRGLITDAEFDEAKARLLAAKKQ